MNAVNRLSSGGGGGGQSMQQYIKSEGKEEQVKESGEGIKRQVIYA